ncbi:hypothetical protein DSO57_1016415 [Entomophthora muscae]|uniref:Uncharacterized protein n=1 Tax=Entomophthora muscae TaxID=34485 RepID=A0ACC2TSW9_9FUNG|nr:hypothetical protein DSO57_1016415 [Entomophthora muscae]
MEPPVTPKPMTASAPDLPTNHTGKLFGIVYITLTGVVDTIVSAAGLWSWVGKSAPYLLKLAPLLWWAMPAKNLAQVTPENNGPADLDWVPDNQPWLPHIFNLVLTIGKIQILDCLGIDTSHLHAYQLQTYQLIQT